MLGKIAVHVSEEDPSYLSYIRDITSRLDTVPNFIYVEEENLLGDLLGFFPKSSDVGQTAIAKSIGELFGDFYLHAFSGTREQTISRLQEDYDLLFVKYRRQLFRRSMPEWLVSETDNLRLWVYKEGARSDIKRVCLPVDFSSRSLKQVEFAEALKDFFDFEYELVYSVNTGRLKDKLDERDYLKSLSDKKEEVRHMYMDMFGEKGLNLVVLEGDPYKEMVKYLNSSRYDLVVVGRRGKGMRERIGSVSLHLIRSLRCPVVVL
ncbi:MAG: universal stress protein [Aquificaceae bacterium]|nr:universal stress protein [Aquificaceae bacterium]